MKVRLCAECRKRVKAAKLANKCRNKLVTHKSATYQQKQSWKYHIAKGMKLNPTPCEERLKQALLAAGLHVETQKQIGPYIADFVLPSLKLVIEADGAQHLSAGEYDSERDRFMHRKGYRVLRVPNSAIRNGCEAVIEAVINERS